VQLLNPIKFSIFLPVKNGGEYLKKCIESILVQTYPNFELIILDNNSADGTLEYLNLITKKDKRIKVVFSSKNLSITENWGRILPEPKNEFMTIIGHDDLFLENFLYEINLLINKNPDANLFSTQFNLIDENGDLIRQCRSIPKYEFAADFLEARMKDSRDSFGTGYVMRSRDYDRVNGIPNYPNLLYSDDALWLKLINSAYLVTSEKTCFSYRLHSKSTSGSPNNQSLFEAFIQYMEFLDKTSEADVKIKKVLIKFGPNYVAKRCFVYFSSLSNKELSRKADSQKLKTIKSLMNRYSDIKIMKYWFFKRFFYLILKAIYIKLNLRHIL
jgi:glycosyltransferase involved in cell wall biosynthesis